MLSLSVWSHIWGEIFMLNKIIILRVLLWSAWRIFLILTKLDLHLAHFDEAAGNLARVAGSESRNHYQHNFLFLMACNPFLASHPNLLTTLHMGGLLLWVKYLTSEHSCSPECPLCLLYDLFIGWQQSEDLFGVFAWIVPIIQPQTKSGRYSS